jgi:hypothetical protein
LQSAEIKEEKTFYQSETDTPALYVGFGNTLIYLHPPAASFVINNKRAAASICKDHAVIQYNESRAEVFLRVSLLRIKLRD